MPHTLAFHATPLERGINPVILSETKDPGISRIGSGFFGFSPQNDALFRHLEGEKRLRDPGNAHTWEKLCFRL